MVDREHVGFGSSYPCTCVQWNGVLRIRAIVDRAVGQRNARRVDVFVSLDVRVCPAYL